MNRLRSTLLLARFMGIQLAAGVAMSVTLAAQWPDFYTCDAGAENCKEWEPSVRQLIYAPEDSKCWCYLTYQQRECNGVTEFRVLSIEPVDYNAMECDSFRGAFETSGDPVRVLAQKRMFHEAMETITEVIAAQRWAAANSPPADTKAVEAMRCPNGYVAVRGVSSYCMSTDLQVSQPGNVWYRITDSLIYVDALGRIRSIYFYNDGGKDIDTRAEYLDSTIQGIPIWQLQRDGKGFIIAPDGSRVIPVPHYELVFTPCASSACCKRETHICYENGYQQKVVQRFTLSPISPPETCKDANNDRCTPWCDESTSISSFSHAGP